MTQMVGLLLMRIWNQALENQGIMLDLLKDFWIEGGIREKNVPEQSPPVWSSQDFVEAPYVAAVACNQIGRAHVWTPVTH